MTHTNRSGGAAGGAALPVMLVLVCTLTVLGCLLLYQLDNKYTALKIPASAGMVVIDRQTLNAYPVVQLVDGWEVYGGQLLSPKRFKDPDPPMPDGIIYIGQLGGLEAITPDASPHGSVTYRLILMLPDTVDSYTLELPEIFSAYRAYVDGVLRAQMGEPEPEWYRPETLNTSITFEASGRTEIIVAVSDFSHLYSGMVYPPAFGLADAVSQLLFARFLFRALLCAVALIIGLLSVLIGVLTRRVGLALLYGLLCLFFVGYIAYPLVKTFFSGFHVFYAMESFSFCAMMVVVSLLLQGSSGIKGWRALVFPLFGVVVCVASVVLHLILAVPGLATLSLMLAYSYLITGYIWVMAAYLTFLSVRAVRIGAAKDTDTPIPHHEALSKAEGPSGRIVGRARALPKNASVRHFPTPILVGIIVFDTALVMDRVLPLYEPIITGWFMELASFALVLCIGVSVGIEIAGQYKSSAVLSERTQNMGRLLQQQQSYFTVLDEKMEDTRVLHHDLRHHANAMDGMIAGGKYDELGDYLSGFRQTIDAAAPVQYSKNHVVNVLANHYGNLAQKQGIRFELHCDLKGEVALADADFSALLSNLLENALEACLRMGAGDREMAGDRGIGDSLYVPLSPVRRFMDELPRLDERFIRTGIALLGSALSIRVSNSADGAPVPSTEGRYTSSKAAGRTGYGLYSIRMIAKKYAGLSETQWDEASETFTHSVTLFLIPLKDSN